MAIKANKSVDFEFEHELEDGSSISIPLRFSSTSEEEYGPVVSVLDSETSEPIVSFPVSMFFEVPEFLQAQGIWPPKSTLKPTTTVPLMPRAPQTSRASSKNTLPLPRVISSSPVNKKQTIIINKTDLSKKNQDANNDLNSFDITDEVANNDSIESSVEKDLAEALQNNVPAEDQDSVESLSVGRNSIDKESTGIDYEEFLKISKERENLKVNPPSAKKIKRRT